MVEDVLSSLQADRLPRLEVFNKSDALTPAQRQQARREGRLALSARTGEGLNGFLELIESRLEAGLVERVFVLPHDRGDLLPKLYGVGRIVSEKPAPGGTRFRVRLDEKNWGAIQKELRNEGS